MTSSSTNARAQWLDLLPLEVCGRIASYVSPRLLTNSLLNLACTSPYQRRAVLFSLSHKLDVGTFLSKCEPWVPLLRPDLVDLRFALTDLQLARHLSRQLVSLLESPKLHHATVADHPNLLDPLARVRSVRSLTVRTVCQTYRELLFNTIALLNLDELCLEAPAMPSGSCLCQDERYFSRDHQGLAAACPNLKVFTFKCRCYFKGSGDPVLHMLSRLPTLKEVGVIVRNVPDIPPSSLAKLRALDSVRIETPLRARTHPESEIRAGHRLAMLVGAAVTVLVIDEYLDSEQIASLQSCPRLSKLDFRIAPGAERALVDVVHKLPSLRSLTLRWPPSLPWERRFQESHPGEAPYSRHIVAVPGAILSVVGAAQGLSDLSLFRVHIGLPEILQILAKMGTRLRRLDLSIRDHEKHIQTLHELLWTIVMCNPNLRVLNIVGTERRGDEVRMSDALWRMYMSCLAALRRLQRRVPDVEARCLPRR